MHDVSWVARWYYFPTRKTPSFGGKVARGVGHDFLSSSVWGYVILGLSGRYMGKVPYDLMQSFCMWSPVRSGCSRVRTGSHCVWDGFGRIEVCVFVFAGGIFSLFSRFLQGTSPWSQHTCVFQRYKVPPQGLKSLKWSGWMCLSMWLWWLLCFRWTSSTIRERMMIRSFTRRPFLLTRLIEGSFRVRLSKCWFQTRRVWRLSKHQNQTLRFLAFFQVGFGFEDLVKFRTPQYLWDFYHQPTTKGLLSIQRCGFGGGYADTVGGHSCFLCKMAEDGPEALDGGILQMAKWKGFCWKRSA